MVSSKASGTIAAAQFLRKSNFTISYLCQNVNEGYFACAKSGFIRDPIRVFSGSGDGIAYLRAVQPRRHRGKRCLLSVRKK